MAQGIQGILFYFIKDYTDRYFHRPIKHFKVSRHHIIRGSQILSKDTGP